MALATIPEAAQSPLHVDEPAEESVTIVVMRGDEAVEVEVLRAVELRHIQKCLCNTFHERFPLMCATLTNSEERTFDDFNDTPFKDAEQNDIYEVAFELTRDMFWFDWADRRCTPSPNPLCDSEMHFFSLE